MAEPHPSAGCTSRSVPRYLGSESFTGEPYAWGQFNTSTSMSTRMSTPSSYYKAGDADGTYAVPSGCAVGTDCSGLTTNMWGLTTKLSTTNIANAAYTSADTGTWDRGEVYVKSGTHVVNFDSYDTHGNMWWYEATTDSSLDRVAFRTEPLSYWSGYSHRRYVNQCP